MELSIDTVSSMASVALSREGKVVAEQSWLCKRRHTAELLPTIDSLIGRLGSEPSELRAVFVCIGPGLYSGLRVGISSGQGLAYSLSLPLIGVGRLDLEAFPYATYPGPIVPVHMAGRGELAWAIYRARDDGDLIEELPPHLSLPEVLFREIPEGALLCGEIDESLTEAVHRERTDILVAASSVRRAGYLATLGWNRLTCGAAGHDPADIMPIYLRKPVSDSPGSASA